MKYILALFIAAVFITGCGGNGNKEESSSPVGDKFAVDTSDIKLEPADDNAAVTLQYSFDKGEKINYRVSSTSHSSQDMKMPDTNLTQSISQSVVYLLSIEVKESDKEAAELSCNINSIKVTASANDKNFNYESGVTTDSAEIAKYSEYEALINNPFTIRLSAKGEILEVFRTDKILNKYLQLKNAPDSITVSEKDMLKKDIVDGALRPVLVQIFRELPDKSVAQDSSWNITQPVSQIYIFQTHSVNKYKIESINTLDEDKIAVINAGVTTDFQGDTKFSDRGINYNFIKPTTSASGKIYFNVTDGCVQKSKTSVRLQISYNMEAVTPQGKQTGDRAEVIETVNVVERIN